MSNFICNACNEQIPPQKARMHCQTCPDYDSCTNCYVLGQFAGNHTAQHPVTLVRNSGVSGHAPQQSAPAQQQQQQNNFRQAPPRAGAWTQLFNQGDATPAPIFVTMMQQIFTCLDPGRTGYITPEAYSSYMEAQGYPPQLNIWRNAYATAFGNKESTADAALKNAYELCSVEHILQPRSQQPQQQSSGLRSTFSSLLLSPLMSGPTGPMPLLTLNGFIKGEAMAILSNPSQGWSYLNRALRVYQVPVWREKGDVPREMIPMVTPPHIQAITQQIQQNAQNQLNAAKMAADIQRQGNLAAVNAIGGTQYEYRYAV